MEQGRLLITNIQRFSLHDGPGIRTTVFLKGCSLHCPWCSNPESIAPYPELYNRNNVEGTYGKYYTCDELIEACLADRNYYNGNIVGKDQWAITQAKEIENLPGGVTFSGGEPLLQIGNLEKVCRKLHALDVHLAVETSLFVPSHCLKLALDHIDFFYVDVKLLEYDQCRDIEGGNLKVYLDNLDTLFQWRNESGMKKPVIVRVPVIGDKTDSVKNRKAVHDLLENYRNGILKIELLQEHNLAEVKYRSLGRVPSYLGVPESLMQDYKEELSDLGIMTEIYSLGI